MAVTLEIIPIPIGSAFVETLGTDDPESLNDFRVLTMHWTQNGTGLQESDITLSTGASLVELTGDGVTREATIRPPTTAGTLTITDCGEMLSRKATLRLQKIFVYQPFSPMRMPRHQHNFSR